jgi:hypothetical protein
MGARPARPTAGKSEQLSEIATNSVRLNWKLIFVL